SREQRAESRSHYFDFLRVAGAFAVMMLHVASHNWGTTDVHSLEWQAMNFYDAIVRWAVPVFVMISGALFLNKDIPLRKIYSKYIFRIFTAFVFWSFVYAVAYYATKRDAVKALGHFVAGNYHMWFLFMIVGLYMIIPFVKKIAESESLTKYFLALAFFFAFLFPETVRIISLFSEKYGEFADKLVGNFRFQFVAGFTVYFLLGYFLNRSQISTKTVYTAGIIGFTATALMSLYASRFKCEAFGGFYGNHTVNVMCEAIAVFVFFRERLNFPARFVRTLSQYSFGAYLVHAGVISLLGKFGLHSLTFSPVISIPVIAVIVFVISFTVSAVLNHIPVLNKYIV
ncbi:MAG: acyltransferase family protein, partial [Synergistaceae bacterium]|nr:acyltransferase family protein [Synergistaceae bacterium]